MLSCLGVRTCPSGITPYHKYKLQQPLLKHLLRFKKSETIYFGPNNSVILAPAWKNLVIFHVTTG